MAVEYLKTGTAAEAAADVDSRVKQTVEEILATVGERGDAAVRELSEKFDKLSPPTFRLSPAEIADLAATLPARTIDDITFAQAQIRHFAPAARGSASS